MAQRKMPDKFPSNSKMPKSSEDRVSRKPVAKGKLKKRSVGSKVKDVFFESEPDFSLKNYMIFDVLVPAVRDTFFDLFDNLNVSLFGSGRRRGVKRSSGYVSYNKQYRKDNKSNSRPTFGYEHVVLPTRRDAEDVINVLEDLTIQYGMASVADLYELVGQHAPYTANKYGWDSTHGVRVRNTRDGFVIEMPQPILLD